MAMSVPKAGFARLLKEGAKHYRGVEEAVLRNIEACIELAAQVRSAYGPNGMNKMVINQHQKLFVTNDAGAILNELEIEHPAAKMLVLASRMQQQEVGDGTNAVIVFGAALLEHAAELIRMGLSPTEISEGYDLAAEKALEILPELVCGKVEDLRSLEQVRGAVRPAIMSKQYGNEDFLADLVAKACIAVVPKSEQSFNVDNIRIIKILGAGVSSSRVMNGMVFKRGVEGEVRKMSRATVAVFTCPFDVTQTETKGTVLMNTAQDLLDYSKGEENLVEEQVKSLAEAGVNTVVCGGKYGELHLHFLNKYKIMGVRLNSKFDVRRICRTTGAVAQTKIQAPTPDMVGHCDEIYLDEVGETEVVVFRQLSESSKVATVVLRGSSDNLMDDIERAVNAGVNTFKALTKDNRLVAGAGCVEVELARRVESIGEKCAGLEQYAIQKYALALEALPKQLADNAGVKSTELLSKLYAAHQDGKTTVGFDNEMEGGGVKDVVAANLVDLFSLKWWAIKLATNAAATILKIDQIIMAKPAGGPKPRPQQGQDADED